MHTLPRFVGRLPLRHLCACADRLHAAIPRRYGGRVFEMPSSLACFAIRSSFDETLLEFGVSMAFPRSVPCPGATLCSAGSYGIRSPTSLLLLWHSDSPILDIRALRFPSRLITGRLAGSTGASQVTGKPLRTCRVLRPRGASAPDRLGPIALSGASVLPSTESHLRRRLGHLPLVPRRDAGAVGGQPYGWA